MKKAGVLGILLILCMAVGPAAGASVKPLVSDGNPKCSEIGCGGADLEWTVPLEGIPAPGTTVTVSNAFGTSVDITFRSASEFDWSDANFQVRSVIVKGGNAGSNVYEYCPDALASDTGLVAPLDKKGVNPDISTIRFCYDPPVAVPEFPSVSVGIFICLGMIGAVLFLREKA